VRGVGAVRPFGRLTRPASSRCGPSACALGFLAALATGMSRKLLPQIGTGPVVVIAWALGMRSLDAALACPPALWCFTLDHGPRHRFRLHRAGLLGCWVLATYRQRWPMRSANHSCLVSASLAPPRTMAVAGTARCWVDWPPGDGLPACWKRRSPPKLEGLVRKSLLATTTMAPFEVGFGRVAALRAAIDPGSAELPTASLAGYRWSGSTLLEQVARPRARPI